VGRKEKARKNGTDFRGFYRKKIEVADFGKYRLRLQNCNLNHLLRETPKTPFFCRKNKIALLKLLRSVKEENYVKRKNSEKKVMAKFDRGRK
jgi:hypothetical protein